MEAEDSVISEVHYFSKEAKCLEENSIGGKEDSVCRSEYTKKKSREADKMSENHLEEKDKGEYTCLLGSNGQIVLWSPESETVLSRFEFSLPRFLLDGNFDHNLRAPIDEDGDFEVIRRNDLSKRDGTIIIEHQSSTTLDLVGEQVWRGAFYLADYILDNPNIFRDANVLEVASGVGLTSIVAAMLAKKVVVTDVDRGDILELIHRNINRNEDICKAKTHIKEIDFFDLRTITDLSTLIDDVTVLLAADVIYHNQLTDAFLNAVLHLMKLKPNKTMFISLEKRYVFTIEDMDTIAPCYEHFVNGLRWLQSQETSTLTWNIEQLPASNIRQHFTYERTKELVLWKIEAFIK